MKQQSQKQIWDNIAEEWNEFKTAPAEHVQRFLNRKKGNILDLGSGSGRHLQKIKEGKMYLVDFSEKMIELAKKKAKKLKINAEFSVSDLSKLPFEDEFFDSAICISSLHCVEGEKNREKAVKELYRVLKPKAEAEIAVWNKCSERFKNSLKEKMIAWRNKGKRYYYLYEPKEVYKLFEKAGFKIIFREEPARMIVFEVRK